MTPSPTERKRELRRRLRAVLAGMTPEGQRAASTRVCCLLQQQSIWREAKVVLLYSPLPEELDIQKAAHAALTEGRIVGVLRYDPTEGLYAARQIGDWQRDLAPGAFGILEPSLECPPLAMNRLDFALVPGLGFTTDGRRLGRGKGYYDRVLAQVRGFKCGVAFDQQIVDEIPTEPHDAQLDCILTPTRWCRVTRGAVPN
jgi:5-formyltetrahydrofolate cyclo-ligase